VGLLCDAAEEEVTFIPCVIRNIYMSYIHITELEITHRGSIVDPMEMSDSTREVLERAWRFWCTERTLVSDPKLLSGSGPNPGVSNAEPLTAA